MIALDSLTEHQDLLNNAVHALNARLSQITGKPTSVSLQATADDTLLQRMIELEKEIFSIEDNVYSREDILSCLQEEDSLLLTMQVDDRIEGYVFGYDDDVENPVVKGTEYFVDSAVVSLQYQAMGIGSIVGIFVLLVLYLVGYKRIGITTEVRDKTGRELVGFYHKLGFVDAQTQSGDDYAMMITLDEQMVNKLCTALGL